MRILVAEDDARIADFVHLGLVESGYSVQTVANGQDAFLEARLSPYDLLILDLILPEMDGFEVARKLRAAGKLLPILMLTARSSEQDTIRGLDAGADDYLTKPFSLGELFARVRALLRRDSLLRSSVLQVDDLTIDTVARRVYRSGCEIELTTREFALLAYLAHHTGRILSRDQLRDHVWGDADVWSNVVDVYIGYLRQKIDKPYGRPLIRTIWGTGYALQATP